ncbi:Holliday junction resolvase [Candidatus Pacearchaeota archaeon]|nr:Holliday junction resolvase [Candidatus Pacearchaeota archaeon]
MGNKEKGANAERELLKMFDVNTWKAVRVAGSGLADESPCDLIAGKSRKKYCIECKTSKDKKRYIDKRQIEDFLIFSEIFGMKPLIAVRFNHEGWFFIKPQKLERTRSKGLAISLEKEKKKGKRFGQIFV